MWMDNKGKMIQEGNLVKIIHPQEFWFNYLSHENYTLLQEACRFPLKVYYLDDDGNVTLVLPLTMESDGDHVTNSLTLPSTDVLIIENGDE